MQHTFYVTTSDSRGREHNYRFLQGEALPDGEKLKTQRTAGQFPISSVLSAENTVKLAVLANSL